MLLGEGDVYSHPCNAPPSSSPLRCRLLFVAAAQDLLEAKCVEVAVKDEIVLSLKRDLADSRDEIRRLQHQLRDSNSLVQNAHVELLVQTSRARYCESQMTTLQTQVGGLTRCPHVDRKCHVGSPMCNLECHVGATQGRRLRGSPARLDPANPRPCFWKIMGTQSRN